MYFRQQNGGLAPLRYVDADGAELADFPELAKAVADGAPFPLALVGDEVKTPGYLSLGWVIEELESLNGSEVVS